MRGREVLLVLLAPTLNFGISSFDRMRSVHLAVLHEAESQVRTVPGWQAHLVKALKVSDRVGSKRSAKIWHGNYRARFRHAMSTLCT